MKLVKVFERYGFLFSELVKRDFKLKYKRTVLGMVWSVLSPLLTLLVLKVIFTQFFGRNTPHFTTYLFSGNIVISYYRESTRAGMTSLVSNSGIISKINVPQYLFLLSRNVSALINFGLTIVLFFIFCIIDHIHFGTHMFMLFYPVICLVIMNIGIGMILSAWYVFFRDIDYLYSVFLRLLTYLSAVFYTIDRFPQKTQRLFLMNPVYTFIRYFRLVVIDGIIPSGKYHLLCAFYALFFFLIGCLVYKKNRQKFLYYM